MCTYKGEGGGRPLKSFGTENHLMKAKKLRFFFFFFGENESRTLTLTSTHKQACRVQIDKKLRLGQSVTGPSVTNRAGSNTSRKSPEREQIILNAPYYSI